MDLTENALVEAIRKVREFEESRAEKINLRANVMFFHAGVDFTLLAEYGIHPHKSEK